MATTLHELLQPQVIMGVVSRIRAGRGRLSQAFGFAPKNFDRDRVMLSGPNTKEGYGRNGSFRIFDDTRIPAMGRAPGTGPATGVRNPMGLVQFSYARFHEKINLLYEDIGNLSPLVGPNAVVDPNGQDYIAQQEKIIAQKFNNAVELMTFGLIRGSFYLQYSGDNILPVLTQPGSGAFQTINYQIPSGNTAQLNMLGGGNLIGTTWANTAATIISDLMNIKAAYVQLTGRVLTDIWVSSPFWYNVIVNTEVRNLAGSAATPFAEFERVTEKDFEGEDAQEYVAILKADPTIKWHITDEVLAVGGFLDPTWSASSGTTLVKAIPDKNALMLPEIESTWCQMGYGSEPVVENRGQQGVQRTGYYFWHEYQTQPSSVDLIGLLNALPLLYVPKAIVFAQPIFP